MSNTPRGAPELVSGQAIPETTANEQIRRTEAGAGRFPVADRVTAPPGTCADGAIYLIIATATGAFAGKENQLAIAVGTNAASGWLYRVPGTIDEGIEAYVQDEDTAYRWSGSAWAIPSSTIEALSWKQPVRVATTGALTLATGVENGDTIDGVTLATGDRVLIKNQSTASENGIYTVNASGAPTRASDADSGAEMLNATVAVSEGTANADTVWICTTNATITLGSTSLSFTQLGATGATYSGGKQTIPILASAMTARTTNGAAAGTAESATNKVMTRTLDFDQSTDEFAQILLPMPKSWDESTITAQFIWTAGATGNVVWGCQAVAISDDDPLDAAFGTAQTVTDGVTAAGDVMISAETSAITIGGTPAEGDLVVVQFYRDADNGSDTLAADARLIAVKLFITTNAATDA